MDFQLHSEYAPTGDQPQAIDALVEGLKQGRHCQTLLGVTGSGKTFTMANVIARANRPTLVLAHNKTLAAQLCGEFKEFFPENAVEFFVSFYDYYQPEAYIASSDTYIAKDSSINAEIEKMRHAATAALLERRDVIIVASVSAIYGLGNPSEYLEMALALSLNMKLERKELFQRLVGMQYARNEIDFHRGSFRAHGDIIDIFPAGSDSKAIRLELFDDTLERLCEIDTLTGEITGTMSHTMIFPASHYVTGEAKMQLALERIRAELAERLSELRAEDKLLEAQRLEQRTNFDLEMLEELGFCSGIENYSRHLTGRRLGEPPFCLLDFFPEDFLLMVDESHVTLPQIRGMYEGDRSRKQSLIDYGFRLPSALDNRPLRFEEFEEKTGPQIYVSATPGPYEEEHCLQFTEQLIRPTGLLDPPIEILPIKGQIDNLLEQIARETAHDGRVLITTLTKKMAEDLAEYLQKAGIKVRYMHSDVKTLERMEIVRQLRLGEFDVLLGINLLREGLDLPEVTLVAILDGDKEGFLRSYRSLIQTIGRAARNVEGRVVIYADNMTDSLCMAVAETNRRRVLQQKYNEEHGITPRSVQKEVRNVLAAVLPMDKASSKPPEKLTKREREKLIRLLEKEMREASHRLEFEKAAELRDAIMELRAAAKA